MEIQSSLTPPGLQLVIYNDSCPGVHAQDYEHCNSKQFTVMLKTSLIGIYKNHSDALIGWKEKVGNG